MKQLARVLRALEDGPATSVQVAAKTGLSIKACSSWLGELVKDTNLVLRTGPHGYLRRRGGVSPYLYELKEGKT